MLLQKIQEWVLVPLIELNNKNLLGFSKTIFSSSVNLRVPKLKLHWSQILIFWTRSKCLMPLAQVMPQSKTWSFPSKKLVSMNLHMTMFSFCFGDTILMAMANWTSKNSAMFFFRWVKNTQLCSQTGQTSTWAGVSLSHNSSTMIPNASYVPSGQPSSNVREHVRYWE